MHVYNQHLIERSSWLGWSRVNHVLSSHSSTNKQHIQHLYVIQTTFQKPPCGDVHSIQKQENGGFCLAQSGGKRPCRFKNRRGYLEIKNYYQLGEEELEANEEVLLFCPCPCVFFHHFRDEKLDGNPSEWCVDVFILVSPPFLYSGYQKERVKVLTWTCSFLPFMTLAENSKCMK